MLDELIKKYGNKDLAWKLSREGWEPIHREDSANHPMPEFLIPTGNPHDKYPCWPEGFCRLRDGRFAFHGQFGETVVAPDSLKLD